MHKSLNRAAASTEPSPIVSKTFAVIESEPSEGQSPDRVMVGTDCGNVVLMIADECSYWTERTLSPNTARRLAEALWTVASSIVTFRMGPVGEAVTPKSYTPEQVSAICDALNSLMESCPRDSEVESWLKMVAPTRLQRQMRVEIWWDEAVALYKHL